MLCIEYPWLIAAARSINLFSIGPKVFGPGYLLTNIQTINTQKAIIDNIPYPNKSSSKWKYLANIVKVSKKIATKYGRSDLI